MSMNIQEPVIHLSAVSSTGLSVTVSGSSVRRCQVSVNIQEPVIHLSAVSSTWLSETVSGSSVSSASFNDQPLKAVFPLCTVGKIDQKSPTLFS